ncbi:MAG: hypothetical protein HOD58_17130 [Gammaproteobacteria bacterium]|jgi:hypothetical protein|nr:hypothetical protein [Gammaproteobacteria bacterium]MBT4331633.1 hypothetical protein [Gammaproteobacteria bacterium]MBT7080046.1 hypothetical protein [Chloroflexota bacterium]
MPSENEKNLLFAVIRDWDAVRFAQMIFRASQVLDDLYDQDHEVPKEKIVKTFWEVLVEIPSNPFYLRNIATLTPLLQGMMLDWIDSCTLERSGSEHEQNVAFVLRDSVSALAIHCAYLVNGYDWMVDVSPDIRRLIFNESVEEYRKELDR